MNAVLQPKSEPIAAYNEFRAQLAELRAKNAAAVFDYESATGNKEARSHVYKLRQTKAAVDKVRKDEKAVALEYGRKVDAEAKEIIGEIEAMIEVHEAPIREIEQREKDRVANLEADIAEIKEGGRYTAEAWLTLPLDAMRDRLAEIEAEPVTEERWQEFVTLAAQKRETAITQIRTAIAQREKHDAEQVELERLRKEAAEREQRDRDERIAREAAEQARKDAEAKAEADRNRAERERAAAQLQAERAEQEKREAEERAARAEQEAKANAEREAKAKAERERQETVRREANKRHCAKINNAAKQAFIEGGLPDDLAETAVRLIAGKKIPNVTIGY